MKKLTFRDGFNFGCGFFLAAMIYSALMLLLLLLVISIVAAAGINSVIGGM